MKLCERDTETTRGPESEAQLARSAAASAATEARRKVMRRSEKLKFREVLAWQTPVSTGQRVGAQTENPLLANALSDFRAMGGAMADTGSPEVGHDSDRWSDTSRGMKSASVASAAASLIWARMTSGSTGGR